MIPFQGTWYISPEYFVFLQWTALFPLYHGKQLYAAALAFWIALKWLAPHIPNNITLSDQLSLLSRTTSLVGRVSTSHLPSDVWLRTLILPKI
jgi:hypothetical protein